MSDKGHIDWAPDYKSPKPGESTAHLYVESAQGIKAAKDKGAIAARARASLDRVTVRPSSGAASPKVTEPNVDAQSWHVAVNGQATSVTADPQTTLSEILTDALLQTGNERWGGEDRWEFVNPRGAVLDGSTKLGELDPSLTSPSGCCLFIQLRPGVGA